MRKYIEFLKGRIRLSIKFSIMIFIILSMAAFISAILMHIAVYIKVVPDYIIENREFVPITLLVACIILGTVFATCASHSIVKTVEKFIEASNKVAEGDFSARLEAKHSGEFKVVAENFNHMVEELAGIEVLRSDFINNFSHEFKTPIVSIKGFAEILKYDDLSIEERKEYLDIVIEEATRLSTLASNVLEMNRIDQQGILTQRSWFNLGEQIRQCVLILAQKIEQKHIDLDLRIYDYEFLGNKEMMSEVWINLIDNAIKFSDVKGMIRIAMYKEWERIKVEISDTGCGINKEALKKIFDKFYQADASHATMGNGLGLSIVKKIIELHGGKIECKSELGKGSTFCVDLLEKKIQ